MHLISRDEKFNNLTIQKFKNLPINSEITLIGPIPHEYLKDNFIFRISHEKGFQLRRGSYSQVKSFLKSKHA